MAKSPREYVVFLRKSDSYPFCRGPFVKKVPKSGRQALYARLPHDHAQMRTVRAYSASGAKQWAKDYGVVCRKSR